MADCKPEVVITQERNEIEMKSQRLPNIFDHGRLTGLVPTLSDIGRHPEIAMAAYKPEVIITLERFEISARFQRILDIFDYAQHAGAIDNVVRCRPTSDRQPEIAMAAS